MSINPREQRVTAELPCYWRCRDDLQQPLFIRPAILRCSLSHSSCREEITRRHTRFWLPPRAMPGAGRRSRIRQAGNLIFLSIENPFCLEPLSKLDRGPVGDRLQDHAGFKGAGQAIHFAINSMTEYAIVAKFGTAPLVLAHDERRANFTFGRLDLNDDCFAVLIVTLAERLRRLLSSNVRSFETLVSGNRKGWRLWRAMSDFKSTALVNRCQRHVRLLLDSRPVGKLRKWRSGPEAEASLNDMVILDKGS